MNSFVLHGENQPESRRRLSEILEVASTEGWEVIRFDWNNIKAEDLIVAARTQSMLSFGHLVAVENFFTNNKDWKVTLEKLPRAEDIGYVFWEGKQISPAILRSLSRDFAVQEFRLSPVVFKLLDSLAPNNSKVVLKLLRDAARRDSADFLLFMIAKHIRNLVWIKEDPDIFRGQEWQKRNLKAQAAKFTTEELKVLHDKLVELDRNNKQSRLPENLTASLDLIFASL